MNIRKTAAKTVLPLLLLCTAPALAATDLDALKACSDAIATKIEKKQGAGVRLTVDDSGISSSARLGTLTAFEMTALDPSSDLSVGEFVCTVDSNARVKSLRTLALHLPVAASANRS